MPVLVRPCLMASVTIKRRGGGCSSVCFSSNGTHLKICLVFVGQARMTVRTTSGRRADGLKSHCSRVCPGRYCYAVFATY